MLTLKWFGTASVGLSCTSGSLLFDPFVPLFGGEAPTALSDYDGYTDIFITHGHVDHIASLPEIYGRNPKIHVYCTGTPYRSLIKKGIPKECLREISYGMTMDVNGFNITVYHGKHAVLPKATFRQLKRIFTGPYTGNLPWLLREVAACPENDETVLYEIRAEGKTITLMGSMNLREGLKYPEESDFLILPYNGWEDNYPPAVSVIESLRPKKVYLDHYDDTFPPVSGPVDLGPVLSRYGDRVCKLKYGETVL